MAPCELLRRFLHLMAGNLPSPHEGQHRIPKGHHRAGSFAGRGRKGLEKIAKQPVVAGREVRARLGRIELGQLEPEFREITKSFEIGAEHFHLPDPPRRGPPLDVPDIDVNLIEGEGGPSIRITGVGGDIDKEVHDLVRRLGRFAKQRARQYAPIGKGDKPGNLKRSIDHGPVTSAGGYHTVDIEADTPYARGVEEGTPAVDKRGSRIPGNVIKIQKLGEGKKAREFRKASVGQFFMRRAFEDTNALAEEELQKLRFDH